MFAKLSERAIRVVRWALVGGWFLLIVSLCFDPLTARFTDPGASASPFRINRAMSAPLSRERYRCPTSDEQGRVDWSPFAPGTCDARCVRIQDRCLVQRPYAMGARFFWTMILPLVPLFLLVFGHEAWRRICPLSALMQIPRLLGVQRRRPHTDPRTGKVEQRVALVSPGGFLARYFWFVQFGLLWLGLSFRLLFINSDRISLAIFFSSVIVIAITVGYFFGGKTWCQYLCPIAPVQKFYTEPRGLFESRAHLPPSGASTLTQSSCRRIDAHGKEQSTCVACRSPCPDIDLERQYWRDLTTAGRRFFYYGYLGLVAGFYWYYRLYSGNWEYYFTGAWTHEENQLAGLLSPGWFFDGQTVPVPKVIAAPVTLALFILAAYALGRVAEHVYDRWRERRGRPLPQAELRHRMFAFFTLLTFNVFYAFAGRPNIALFPAPVRTAIDTLFVVVSTVWFVTRLPRTTEDYDRESNVGTLKRQLVQLRVDTPRLFGGRSLDHLRTDEVYTLGKVLPELTAIQGRAAYRETVRQALAAGHARSAAALEVLRTMREQLKVSDGEHLALIAELGVEGPAALDPGDATLKERRVRIEAYRGELEAMLAPVLEEGRHLGEALRDPDVQAHVSALQASYGIDQVEHEEVCQALLGSDGALVRRAQDALRQLVRFGRMHATLSAVEGAERPLARLLNVGVDRRCRECAVRVAAHLSAFGESEESLALVRLLSRPAAAAVVHACPEPDPALRAVLEERLADDSSSLPALPLELVLNEIATSWDPLARSVARRLAGDAGATGTDGQQEDPERLERMSQLCSSPLFERLSLETLAELATRATLRSYAPGELIRPRGALGDNVLIVATGSAQLLVDTELGTAKRAVESGQTIGELGALTGAASNDAAVATGYGASVLSVPAGVLRALVDRDARAASNLLRLVSERLRKAQGSSPVSSSSPRNVRVVNGPDSN